MRQVAFYPSRYAAEKCSILPVGDPTSYIPDSEVGLSPRLWNVRLSTLLLRCKSLVHLCLIHAVLGDVAEGVTNRSLT